MVVVVVVGCVVVVVGCVVVVVGCVVVVVGCVVVVVGCVVVVEVFTGLQEVPTGPFSPHMKLPPTFWATFVTGLTCPVNWLTTSSCQQLLGNGTLADEPENSTGDPAAAYSGNTLPDGKLQYELGSVGSIVPAGLVRA